MDMMDGDGTRRLEGRHRAGARRGSRAWLGVQAVLGCCAVVGLLAVPAAAQAPDFATEVHPILAERCYVCHGEQRDRGGLRLDSRAAILEGGDTGAAAVPGDSAASAIIARITADDPDVRMPPDRPPLPADEIAILRAWVDAGLAWDLDALARQAHVTPLALRETPPVPPGTHIIDHYLADYFARHGMDTPPAAPDHVFLRRAFLDTIGLLPDPEAVQAFARDAAPGKHRRWIGRLLARDGDYAEHWMSYWNDVLRNDYEGTGYIDGGRQHITRWLYDALLENRAYDTMVRGLIAPEEPGAEGFIAGIVWRGDSATVQQPAMQAAQNVAQGFLGVNLKCASCHDSFVDHWKLDDAFGLANAFSAEPMEKVRCDVPTGEAAIYRFLWPELGEIDGSLPREARMAQVATLTTTPENGHFARTMVNRLWARFYGRGLVEPLDAIERAAWHPELLDALAHDFIGADYDLKHLMDTLLSAEAYRWRAAVYPEPEAKEAFVFRGPAVRRMTAEQFYDALGQVTGQWQVDPSFLRPGERPAREDRPARLRGPVRAWRVVGDPLTRALGRTNREQMVTRRENDATTLQALELTNGETLAQYLHRAARTMAAQYDAAPPRLVREVWLRSLQRTPTRDERGVALALLGDSVSREGLEDLMWAVAMLPEFQLVF